MVRGIIEDMQRPTTRNLERENARLREELARLREERDTWEELCIAAARALAKAPATESRDSVGLAD